MSAINLTDKRREMMIERLSFPGIFFCPCGRLEALFRAVTGYISQIEQNGTNAKIEVFKGLSHGFGLGEGTVAEGWIDHAVSFWEDNMSVGSK